MYLYRISGKKVLGLVLVLLVNIIYIGSNYMVKWAELGAGEVTLVRGALQILVFSTIIGIQRRGRGHKGEVTYKAHIT